MTAWSEFWAQRASGKTLGASFAVCLLFYGLFAWAHMALEQVAPGAGTPDTLGFVGPAALHEQLAAMGPAGQDHYIAISNIDMFYPFGYGSFMLLATAWGYRDRLDSSTPLRAVMCLPPLGMAADYVENICTRLFMADWPDGSDAVASIWVVGHTIKWGTLLPCLVVAVVAIARGVKRTRAAAKPT